MVQKISLPERELLFKLLCEKTSISNISHTLGRHTSTVYREINRLPSNSYSPITAQAQSSLKAKNSKKRKILQNINLKNYVLEKLYSYWSPEQISHRLPIDYPNDPSMRVSHETIYRFIYGLEDLNEKEKIIKCLRRRKKRRYSRKKKKENKSKIRNLISIRDRPKEVEVRQELGHWEGDFIVGKDHKTAIATIVERVTRYTIIIPLIENKDSFSTYCSFSKVFNSLPVELKKSLTYDRGTEMASHELFTKETGVNVFFADPHSPWQRGTNENTNGLIRQFCPKKTDFSNYPIEEFANIKNNLNNRPRKILGYMTPKEKLILLLKKQKEK